MSDAPSSIELIPGEPLWVEPGSALCLPWALPPDLRWQPTPDTEPRDWAPRIVEQGITQVCLWPSTLARWLADGLALPATLRLVYCGGEPLPRSVAEAFARQSQAALIHSYTPDGATQAVLAWRVDGSQLRSEAVPVGWPLRPDTVRLQDKAGRVAPVGTVGQLQVCDAHGLWQATSDLARCTRQGLFELTGRADASVRLRGQRVEPLALRNALLALPAVADAHVGWRLRADSGAELVAWVVPRLGVEAVLPAALWQDLPQALRPQSLLAVSNLPLSRAGEIDEAALDALGAPDELAAARWEQRLGRTPGVSAAAVLTLPLPPTPRGFWSLPEKAEVPLAPAEGLPGPTGQQGPLESHGPALPALSWPSLGAALVACADAEPGHGVHFLDAEGARFLPYPALLDAALRMLGGLRADGAQAGDPVLLLLNDQQSFLTGFWACVLGGLVPVPVAVPPSWEPDHAAVQRIINVWQLLEQPRVLAGSAEASGLATLACAFAVSVAEHCAQAPREAEWHPAQADDPALMLLTSGSTGTPKAVIQTHRTVLSRCEMARLHHGLHRGTVSLNWLPLDHVGAIVMFHVRDVTLQCRQLHAPTELVIAAPLRWLDWMEAWKVNVTWAPNFAFALINAQAADIAQRHWDLSSVKVIVNAGEAIVPATARRFLALLGTHGLSETAMCPEWGMSETCSAVVGSRQFTLAGSSDADAFADLGRPLAGTSLRIVDAQPSRSGTPPIGRLQVRGPSVTPGYFRNEAAMRESFTDDGWFDTGDLGYLQEGRLTLTGRGKDCIIINGVNLYSHEVEAIVETLDGVAVSYTAACAHRPAGADTDEMVVFFVPAEHTPVLALGQRIRAEITRRLGVSPRHLVPVTRDEIPKTAIGKIQRAQLQHRFKAGDFSQRTLARGDITASPDGLPDSLPDGLAAPRWLRAEAHAPLPLQGPWLLVGGSAAMRSRMTETLLAAGATVVDQAESVPSIQDSTLACTEHLLWLDLEPGANADPVDTVGQVLGAAQALADRLLARPDTAPPLQWLVLTRGVAPIELQPTQLAHAALPAWLASVGAEHPGLRTRVIDLDSQAHSSESTPSGQMAWLLDDGEPLVAWRRGKRWVPRMEPVTPKSVAVRPWRFEQGSTWLMAGGLGGVGQAVAQRLSKDCGIQWLIAGRRPPSHPEVVQALARLQSEGVASQYLSVDISDSADLTRQVAEALGSRRLAGVIQAAADGSLAAQWAGDPSTSPAQAQINQQFKAKVAGSLGLAALLQSHPGAAFVGFSSVTATFGAATLAGYAAANAFLSALCVDLQRQGHPASALEWSMWASLGLSAGAPEALRERTLAQGYDVLTARQGGDALLIAASLGLPRLLVGIRPQHPAWRARGAGPSTLLCGLSAFVVAPEKLPLPQAERDKRTLQASLARLPELPQRDGQIDRAALAALHGGSARSGPPREAPQTDWQHRVHAVWSELLGLPAISIHDNFFEIGGHSMLLTRARARLSALAGRELPMVDLFRQSSIARLAQYLEQGEPEPAPAAATPPIASQRQQALLEQQRRRAGRAPHG